MGMCFIILAYVKYGRNGFQKSTQKARSKIKKTVTNLCNCLISKWSHLGSNQGPPDYESGALTN